MRNQFRVGFVHDILVVHQFPASVADPNWEGDYGERKRGRRGGAIRRDAATLGRPERNSGESGKRERRKEGREREERSE